MVVVGVDVWAKAWVTVAVDRSVVDVRTFAKLAEAVSSYPDAAVFGVDIPIGLPTAGNRHADTAARQFVGPRGSSVFSAPPRAVLTQPSYQAALAFSRKEYDRGLSAQSYALGAKILEAEQIAHHDDRVFEVHPEVSFRALKGAPLESAKKTWNGQMERRALLAGAGLELPEELSEAGRVAPDDVLDATAAVWSARRIAEGTHSTLPDPPQSIEGRPVAIWF